MSDISSASNSRLSPGPTGAAIARLFSTALAALFLIAWVSLAWQFEPLLGRRGIMPWADYLDLLQQRQVSAWAAPTYLWFVPYAWAPWGGLLLGMGASIVALLGRYVRPMFALNTLLYLSFVSVGRSFLSFQWDNLLLECGLLACMLPQRRPAPLMHWLFRLLLFKLYVESGIAKWHSALGDWHDGSAMTFYFETAPLPTWLGWYAQQLPVACQHLLSYATLGLELVVPFAIFGSRPWRLAAAGLLTGFQLINLSTANYGFFCYLSLALHVFLLDERDAERLFAGVAPWVRFPTHLLTLRTFPMLEPIDRGARIFLATLFVYVSGVDAAHQFGGQNWPGTALAQAFGSWRLINTYHLFGSITRSRIEPEFQTFDGAQWRAQDLWHKPGAVQRAPDFVAPHQPRLDFQLWFYGLNHQHMPGYVSMLLARLCQDPAAVQRFFAESLPATPQAVRVAYWTYHMTDRSERNQNGAFWRRADFVAGSALPCANLPSAVRPVTQ